MDVGGQSADRLGWLGREDHRAPALPRGALSGESRDGKADVIYCIYLIISVYTSKTFSKEP